MLMPRLVIGFMTMGLLCSCEATTKAAAACVAVPFVLCCWNPGHAQHDDESKAQEVPPPATPLPAEPATTEPSTGPADAGPASELGALRH